MEFGWINLFGAAIVILLLIPNVIYAVKNRGEKNRCKNVFMNVLEQIGRFACIILMWLPLLVWSFGFPSAEEMTIYLIGNGALLIAYYVVFVRYMKQKTKNRTLTLAILPACIFLLSGLLLRHWLLAGFSVVFAFGHIYVTLKNAEAEQGA